MDSDFDPGEGWTDNDPEVLRQRGYPERLIALMCAQFHAMDSLIAQTHAVDDEQATGLLRAELHIQLYLHHLRGIPCIALCLPCSGDRQGVAADAGIQAHFIQ